MKCRSGSRVGDYGSFLEISWDNFPNVIFTRIEIWVFLKFVRIEISDGSGGISSSGWASESTSLDDWGRIWGRGLLSSWGLNVSGVFAQQRPRKLLNQTFWVWFKTEKMYITHTLPIHYPYITHTAIASYHVVDVWAMYMQHFWTRISFVGVELKLLRDQANKIVRNPCYKFSKTFSLAVHY